MARMDRHGNVCLLPLLALVLLVLLPGGGIVIVSAQRWNNEGTTRTCSMNSVSLNRDNWRPDGEYQRLEVAMTSAGRQCPYNTVCAQKVTAEEGSQVIYSEDCWDERTITEYTEVACNYDLCNGNLTLGGYIGYGSSSRRHGSVLQCYNHGQLQVGGLEFGQIISNWAYRLQFSRDIPISYWSNGMCGAAIYASNRRYNIIHERVLTGDRKSKFAMLRKCSSRGCDRSFMRDVLRGY